MNKKITLLLFTLSLISCRQPVADNGYRQFSFVREYTYPGTPEFVYDHLTGDIGEWWDHSFSENPYRLFIEPRPGGGFYEYFDESGNGVLHATVTAADRGKMLRLDGPLGLAGKALTLVCTCTLETTGSDSTLLRLEVHASGEIETGLPQLVEQVWDHFLGERFTPYMEGKFAEKNSSTETLSRGTESF